MTLRAVSFRRQEETGVRIGLVSRRGAFFGRSVLEPAQESSFCQPLSNFAFSDFTLMA